MRERTEEEQRDFERGREEAQAKIRELMKKPVPAASWAPEPDPYLQPQQFRGLPPGEKGTWYRTTAAGRLAAVMAPFDPNEEADEARRAREWVDRYEYVYGRRPSLTQARYAVSRRSDGVVMGGNASDLAPVFRQAGIRYAVINETEPLPADPVNVIREPVRPG
jgi:hypothetical protein